jgi:hypothetical protein
MHSQAGFLARGSTFAFPFPDDLMLIQWAIEG